MHRPNLTLSAVTLTSSTEGSLPITLDLNRVEHLDRQLDILLPLLAQYDDTQLVQIAAHARKLETCAFRLRGACVAELRRRTTTRLAGGRGKRDTTGAGIQAQLTRLAAMIGVSVSTLKTDARIHEIFFSGVGKSRLARAPTLSREYYVVALGAPDPHGAIQIASKRLLSSHYNRKQFRRDVLALKSPRQLYNANTSAPVKPKTADDNFRVKIKPEARSALAHLMQQHGQSDENIVAAALLAYYQSRLAATTDSLTTTTPASIGRRRSSSHSPPNAQPSLPLLQPLPDALNNDEN